MAQAWHCGDERPLRNQSRFLLILGIGSLIVTTIMGAVLFQKYGPSRIPPSVPQEIATLFKPTSTPLPQQTVDPSVEKPTPTPTPEAPILSQPDPVPWMTYDGIDLSEQEVEILLTLTCRDQQVYIPPFTIIPWHPEVFTNGQFAVTSNNAVAWEHLGVYGLWVHSGQDMLGNELTAFPIQNMLERNEKGVLHNPESFTKALNDCFLGGELLLKQGDTISRNNVVAAVRVPSSEVAEVSSHVMDLTPYLMENYPDSGFDQLQSPGMLLYFCGRRLDGESYNSTESYWTQSRIIIGFEPVNAGE